MKSIILGLVLILGVGVSQGSEDPKLVKQNLIKAHQEFQELAVDLPFERVYFSWKEKIREVYKQAGRDLLQAIALCETNQTEAVRLLQNSQKGYRQAGLILPFFEINRDKTDTVLSDYMKAQDTLTNSITSLTKTGPVPSGIWRNDGKAWKLLPQKMGAIEAGQKCAQVMEKDVKSWKVPSLRELALVFRAMKNPLINTAFGQVAQDTFEEVWTSDLRAPGSEYYYINFRLEASGSSFDSSQYIVVCMGEDLL